MVQKGDNMSLTKKELENAYHISREIQDIERQIERLTKKSGIVSDTVCDYRTGTGIPIAIYGYAEKDYKRLQRLVEKLQNKQAELLREKIRIEEELEHIADAGIRRIIRLRYFDCLSWEAVAIAIDGTKSGDAMRMKLERFLQA